MLSFAGVLGCLFMAAVKPESIFSMDLPTVLAKFL